MADIVLLADAIGATVTAPPIDGLELPGQVSRRLLELRGGQHVRASFAESLGNALIGCRIEVRRFGGVTFGTLVPDFFSRGTPDGLVFSDELFFSAGDETAVGSTNVEVRALILGNGILSPIIRYVILHVR